MRKSALLLLCVPLALAACGPRTIQAPDAYDVSGSLGGSWGTEPRLRLALVGAGFPEVVTNNSNLAQNVVSTGLNAWNFGVDLPNVPGVAGVYQVVAYNDANNNATLDGTEVDSVARNQQWLIYSQVGGNVPATRFTPEMNVTQGWNLYDKREAISTGNPRPGQKVTGYDLSR
ncbi:hypothetical protein [Deinococcus sp. QL22]|uniref:hypothetical protein n=1 Tax=Deinococcus sp. QL22 TaxID=2939437 RepID=UPI002016B45A|nr:hypothetical protein [Deinococcus sp. QL22]UQN07564.1 hypothetical protein M1R55_06675 [Deinococcus sp. QL22]